jgi:hypothetical protein
MRRAGLALLAALSSGAAAAADGRAAQDAGDACGGLDVPACAALAEKYRFADGLYEGSRALPLYFALCARGHAESCFEAAETDEGEKQRVLLYVRSCDGGWGRACAALARFYKNGTGGLTKNTETALRYYEIACARKDEAACAFASSLYSGATPGFPKDERKARLLDLKARSLGWRPEPPDVDAPPWRGPLYCATMRLPGVAFSNFACAGDARTCDGVAKEIVSAEPSVADGKVSSCELVSEPVVLHCMTRAGKLVCSAQEPFCYSLAAAAGARRARRSAACLPYRGGTSSR